MIFFKKSSPFSKFSRSFREMRTLSAFISSDSMRGTHLAQTFRNPRTPIMCPTLSLQMPNATAISFCLMRQFPRISSSTRPWWSWSLAVTGPSTSCFVTQICLPQFSIFEPPYPASYCTHINKLITINDLHSSVNFNWGTFSAFKNSITARCLNRTSENSSISICTGWGL